VSADNILLAIPNISEGRNHEKVERVAGSDNALIDVQSDVDHNRSVLTYGGEPEAVVAAVAAMIDRAIGELDLREQHGAHPRFGVVDVLPFVPYSVPEQEALKAATGLVWRTAETSGVPIHFYERAAEDRRTLPQLRRWLRETKPPVHPSAGVICVGVRDPLIAFNVNFRGSLEEAGRIAKEIRDPDVRALGFELPSRELVQVSMNLVDPMSTGPAAAYARVAEAFSRRVVDCDVVGLVPDAVIPQLDGLPLRSPARSVEQALRENL
jgi:glutamate formiminotransferase